jgi:hypothetical protein
MLNPQCNTAAFAFNAEPHTPADTGASPSVNLCLGLTHYRGGAAKPLLRRT